MNKNDWKQIYLGYVNDTPESLAKQAKDFFLEICKAFSEKTNDPKKAFLFGITLFASYIDADGTISREEWALFNYIFNVEEATNYESIEQLVENFRKYSSYDELDAIIDQCDTDLKSTIIKFGLCVCAIDENVPISEQRIIEKYAD